MKKQIKTITLVAILSLVSFNGFAQVPPPPPNGGHGQSGNQNGGSAPIGGGLFVLLGLGAAYGGKKLYSMFSGDKEELES